MASEGLHSAVAAGVLASEREHRELLQSIVEVARAIFGARAASIFLLDETTDELVFEAVSGEGSDMLVGQHFPSSRGIAGWVLVTRQPLVIDDVTQDPRFAEDFARATGYVPRALMAVPLLSGEHALGVLQILDRHDRGRFELGDMDLLALFASQAAIGLALLQRARRANEALEGSGLDVGTLARVGAALDSLTDERREAGLRLLRALEELLEQE
jgi:GAF domain-containing protein